MAAEDGAGVRVGTGAVVRLWFRKGHQPLDLSPATRTVAVICKLNGGADLTPSAVAKVSVDGVEAAGASGAVDITMAASQITAAGTLTAEATFGGTPVPVPNPNQKVIQIPVRPLHANQTP